MVNHMGRIIIEIPDDEIRYVEEDILIACGGFYKIIYETGSLKTCLVKTEGNPLGRGI